MLISYNWLREFAEFKEKPQDLAGRLTMCGIEVSSINKEKDDYLFNVEITPNRPDLLSMIGIAREASCLTAGKFTLPKAESFKKNIGENIDVQIKATSASFRYNATLIKDVEVKVSNQKITGRLNSLGIRPVNNIVDITNYCLLETGQPLHAFDYDKIKGGKVIVRWAEKGESIRAIDGNEYKLDEDMLVIADSQSPIAIAGIMGGIDTEIDFQTKNVLLECAHFDPLTIRRTSRKLGLSSDSSYRFERGVCLENISQVAQRASYFIAQIPGAKITDNVDLSKKRIKDRFTILRKDEIKRILGFDISAREIKRILTGLGFRMTSLNKNKMKIKIPPFRNDILREVDLIEEIARIYGYDKIPGTLAKVSPKRIQKYRSSPTVSEDFKYKAKQTIVDTLISCGISETINYSLTNKAQLKLTGYDRDATPLKNPLSIEQGILRPTVLVGLLNTVAWNLNRQIDRVSIFEVGKTFKIRNENLLEEEKIAICLCGDNFLDNWQIKPKAVNFFDLKGIIEFLLITLGVTDYKFNPFNNTLFLNNQSAKITVAGQDIAVMGKVREDILDKFDIETDVYAAEIEYEKILSYMRLEPKVKPIPKYPHIRRDIAVIVNKDLESKAIVNEILKIGRPLASEVALFDIYTGKQIPPGYRSLAYSIKFQSQRRTLTDEEVDEIQEKIQKSLVENLKAQIR
jgi:phenylalanyl-tRNA synthetase beta chain